MGRKFPLGMLAWGLAWGMVPVAALAQTEPMLPLPPLPVAPNVPIAPGVPLERGITVVDRERPEVSPLGLRFGPWFFFPRGEVDEAYNDNITAGSGNPGSPKEHDFITALAPSFDLRSNFPTNALNVSAGAVISRYAKHSAFNTEDGFGAVDGRLDVDAAHDIHAAVRAERGHEDPGAPTVPGNIAQPVRFNDYSATAGFAQTRLRIGYSADATIRREEYEAVPLVGGGILPESERNNFSYEGALRGYYEFVPGYQAFLRGAYNLRSYDHSALGTPTRNSQGFRTDVGSRIDLTGITYFEGYVGYIEQDYRSNALGTVRGVDFGANLAWNVTQLSSISLKAARTIVDTNFAIVGAANSPAFLHTTAGVSLDHELLRNLLLNANAAYVNDDFKGINRTDDGYDVGAGAKYLLNRYLYLGANYTYERRDSSGTAAATPFTRNIFLVRVSTQL
jgi:hypothetical protein